MVNGPHKSSSLPGQDHCRFPRLESWVRDALLNRETDPGGGLLYDFRWAAQMASPCQNDRFTRHTFVDFRCVIAGQRPVTTNPLAKQNFENTDELTLWCPPKGPHTRGKHIVSSDWRSFSWQEDSAWNLGNAWVVLLASTGRRAKTGYPAGPIKHMDFS